MNKRRRWIVAGVVLAVLTVLGAVWLRAGLAREAGPPEAGPVVTILGSRDTETATLGRCGPARHAPRPRA